MKTMAVGGGVAAGVLASGLFMLTLTGGFFVSESIVLTVKKPTTTHAATTTPAHPDGPASSWTYSEPIVLERDTVVTGIAVEMHGAPLETLHHLSVFAAGTPDAVCGDTTHASLDELYTASRNNVWEPVSFPAPYGLHLSAGTSIVVEFMEHTREVPHGPGGHYEDHVLEVTLRTAPASKHPVALEFIRPRLDDTPCAFPVAHQAFTVPAGEEPFERRSTGANDGEYIFAEAGVLLLRSANVWPDKGGQSLSLYINDVLKEVFEPVEREEAWQFSIPARATPIPVAAGDRLTIAAIYKNPFPTPVRDASGILGFYFAPGARDN